MEIDLAESEEVYNLSSDPLGSLNFTLIEAVSNLSAVCVFIMGTL